jgi:type III secretion protein U
MSDKTEEPTHKRLRKARKDGDIAKSVRLTATLSGICWWLILLFEAPHVYQLAQAFVDRTVRLDWSTGFDRLWSETLAGIGGQFLPVALGTLGLGALAVVLPELAQTRGALSFKKITPRFDHLNPVNGLKNLFGAKSLVDLALSAVQCGILGVILVQVLTQYLRQLVPGYALGFPAQLIYITDTNAHLIALMSLSQLALSCADYFIQRFLWLRRLRMDKQEVKREHRDDEGDGHVKGRRRALHQELSQ